jgi:hypothetical protein
LRDRLKNLISHLEVEELEELMKESREGVSQRRRTLGRPLTSP